MRASVIFHSVCGNTLIMACSFMKALKRSEGEVTLYRVKDEDVGRWTDLQMSSDEVAEYGLYKVTRR